jgi:hypothetical protein
VTGFQHGNQDLAVFEGYGPNLQNPKGTHQKEDASVDNCHH